MDKIVDVVGLAETLGVPQSWVYRHTRSEVPDPIPHLKIGKYVRFDTNSQVFRDWLARRGRKRSAERGVGREDN